MRNRILIGCFLILSVLLANAQTVLIQSDSIVCLNQPLSLQANTTGTVVSYSWDLGDGTSSTQQNTQHSYTSFGFKTISLEVTFAGGTKKTATKKIQVHDLPAANFVLGPSEFCFNRHKICLVDKSKMGATTSGYDSRIVLWGDGASVTNNSPSEGDTVCYNSYPKPSPPSYTIEIEVTNNKGCKNQWDSAFVIKKNYKPSFDITYSASECNFQKVCFGNDSLKSTEIQSVKWDFGDGNSENIKWNTCHNYEVKGSLNASLIVTLKNGCTDTLTKLVEPEFDEVHTSVSVTDTILCFPEKFRVSNLVVANADYRWELFNSDTVNIQSFASTSVAFLDVKSPNDYFIRIILKLNNCSDTSDFFSIHSVGGKADFRPLNVSQCNLDDTVYFFNQSLIHPNSNISYTWNFDDSSSGLCYDVSNNCNFDSFFHSEHFYDSSACFSPKLILRDVDYGCLDSTTKTVSMLALSDAQLTFAGDKRCLGGKQEYGISFGSSLCLGGLRVCKDSLNNDKAFFVPEMPIVYTFAAHPDNWLTVGLELSKGDSLVYRSADTNDYYVDYGHQCVDTFWQHNWFQLHREPRINFKLDRDTACLPVEIAISYNGNEEDKIKYYKYKWGENPDVLTVDSIQGAIPDVKHVYNKAGAYRLFVEIEDTNGCFANRVYRDTIGYFSNFSFDSTVCENELLQLNDSIRYFGIKTALWDIAGTPEKLIWDFGDGGGFLTTLNDPFISYPSKGVFTITLATEDAEGCRDTLKKNIYVLGINAGIKDQNREFLCDQIIQFFDSSYFDSKNDNDSIVSYYWNFGDETTDSYLENPFHFYKDNKTFVLTHAVESAGGCKDTAEFSIYLKGPEPSFEIISDTMGCAPFIASFKSKSENISSLIWKMDDPLNTQFYSKKDTTINFEYKTPGIYYIYIEGSDVFYNDVTQSYYTCKADFPDTTEDNFEIRKIIVLPTPNASFSFIEPACVGQPVSFVNTSDNEYTNFRWTIAGDYDSTSSDTFFYTFDKPGNYAVNFSPNYIPDSSYQRHCFDEASDSIEIIDIEAEFRFIPISNCNEYLFTDSSRNAEFYKWNFDDIKDNTATTPVASHDYPKDSTTYNVCLTVSNSQGCVDTICKKIATTYIEDLKLYNVFTPNDDTFNDKFYFLAEGTSDYSLNIYNRWGELVFDTKDKDEGWDGTINGGKNELPEATYFYILRYRYSCGGALQTVEGTVELIR